MTMIGAAVFEEVQRYCRTAVPTLQLEIEANRAAVDAESARVKDEWSRKQQRGVGGRNYLPLAEVAFLQGKDIFKLASHIQSPRSLQA